MVSIFFLSPCAIKPLFRSLYDCTKLEHELEVSDKMQVSLLSVGLLKNFVADYVVKCI
jgi:hypothetical protein